jgi:type I restriction enzyme S subunit
MSDLYELPNGWEWKKLTDIVQIGCDRGFSPTVVEGKVPFIGMSDIDENKGRNTKYILEDFAKVSKGKTKFQRNAVLVGKITPCTQNNKTTIVPSDIDGGFATTEVYALHSLNKIKPLYLNFYIRSNAINEYLVNSMIGATGRQRVPSDTIKNLNIPLPPLSEQQRIVSKLDKLFEKTDKSIALHQKNMDEADVFMRSVLNEVFGGLEEKYEKSQLNEHCQITSSKRVYKSDYVDDGVLFLRIKDIVLKAKNKPIEDSQYISKDAFDKFNEKFGSPKSGDILLTAVGATLGYTYLVTDEDGDFYFKDGNLLWMKDIKDLDRKYLLWVFKSPIFDRYLDRISKGAAQPAITIVKLKEFEIPIPPLNIQQKVADYLDEIAEKIEKVKSLQKQKMDNLKSLKSSILDKAFKGEL